MSAVESTQLSIPIHDVAIPAKGGNGSRNMAIALNACGLVLLAAMHSTGTSSVQQLFSAGTLKAVQPATASTLAAATQTVRGAQGLRAQATASMPQTAAQAGRTSAPTAAAAAAPASHPQAQSTWFVLLAFVTGVVGAKVMEWRQCGMFGSQSGAERMELAMFSASGEKSAVDALDALFGDEPEEKKPVAAPAGPVLSYDEVLAKLGDLSLDNAASQVAALNGLELAKWNAASQRLNYTPVTMRELERNGLDAIALGIVENVADLETVKNYTIGSFVFFSALAVLAGLAFPGNTGASLMYLIGAIPVVLLSIGSVSPGLIVALISFFEDGKEGKAGNLDEKGVNRRVRHEAAHFLVGYMLGLPIAEYDVEDATARVEFHPTTTGEMQPGQRLTKTEIDKLCVIALSGAVGETLSFPNATGGGADLQLLQRLLLACEERLNQPKQQEQTRFGAMKAKELLKFYGKEYEALCDAFARKASVKECIAIVESTTR